jgi:hypothetical protein
VLTAYIHTITEGGTVALLTVNDDVTLPGTVVCLDVQTYDEPDELNSNTYRKRLRCWSAIAGRMEGNKWTREKSRHGNESPQFWEWLNFVRIPQRPVWLFANSCRTALTCLSLWRLLESGEYSLFRRPTPQVVKWREQQGKKDPLQAQGGFLVDNQSVMIAVFFHKSGWKVTALDSANYFTDCPATTVGDQDRQLLTVPSVNAPIANWLEFSTERCGALRDQVKVLLIWHRNQELGRFAMTISGIALAGFRHRFMHHYINLPEDQDVRDWERTGFYQGRVEALWVGSMAEGDYTPMGQEISNTDTFNPPPSPPYYLLDARSMYGAVGQFCCLPCQCIESSQDSCYDAPDLSRDGIDVMATVELESPHAEFPVRVDGRVFYARGNLRTTLAGPELSRAVRDRLVTKWIRWQRYETALIFRPFSQSLWTERQSAEQKGDLTWGSLAKSLLARLHGKFLQRSGRWENRPKMFAAEPYSEWWDVSATTHKATRFRSIGYDVQEEVDAGDSQYCFPAIASWVTSYAREWLRSWMEIAGERNVLYVATDSLIVTEQGRANLEKAGILGDYGIGSLRVVQTADSITIRGIANLEIGGKRCRGGERLAAPASVGGSHTVNQLDSLETVLWVRRGQWISETARPADFTRVPRGKKVHPGGWLEAPTIDLGELAWTPM